MIYYIWCVYIDIYIYIKGGSINGVPKIDG